MSPPHSGPVLEVNLTAGYKGRTVLDGLQLSLQRGERFGLLGTSGAGKSTLLFALLGLLPWRGGWARGQVLLEGKNLLELREREARRLRGKVVALVPQSPASALNSGLSLKTHFQEAWRAHESGGEARLMLRLESLLRRVQLPANAAFLKRRPGEISVGQAQRCVLALALLHRPSVLIADEATSALDPATQAEVLSLLREVSEEERTALLFVSHDLLSVLRLCRRFALLHEGRIVETAPVDRADQVQHPVLQRLLRTLPVPASVLLQYAEPRSLGSFDEMPPTTRDLPPHSGFPQRPSDPREQLEG